MGGAVWREESYSDSIATFVDAQAFHHEHGGYPGFQDELLEGGVVRLADKLLIFATRVLCKLPDSPGVDPVPCIWFYVCRANDADGFVVQVPKVVEALQRQTFPAATDPPWSPVSAYKAGDPDGTTVAIEGPLDMTTKGVRLERPARTYYQQAPTAGIRFELREKPASGETPSLFTAFTMTGITPFLALAVAMDKALRNASSFSEELDEFARELGRPTPHAGKPEGMVGSATESYEKRIWEELLTLLAEAVPEGANEAQAEAAITTAVAGADAEIADMYRRIVNLSRADSSGYIRRRMHEDNAITAVRQRLGQSELGTS